MTNKKSEINPTGNEVSGLRNNRRFSIGSDSCRLLILVPAGTFNFWQVYVYIGNSELFNDFCSILLFKKMILFFRTSTRAKRRKKYRNHSNCFSLMFLIRIVIPGLDKRFGWSDIRFILFY